MPLNPDERTNTQEDNPGGGPLGLIIAFLLVAISAIAIYSASMHGPFVLDDEFIIVNNPLAHDVGKIWPPVDPRYIGYLSFALNYAVSGLDTFGYHIVNVAIHIINGLLVYLLVISLFRTARSAGYNSGGAKSDPMVPLAIVSALLFTVHPINTQAVTYIVQRFASLATLLYLLALILYLEWGRAPAGGRSKGLSTALYILSLLCTAAAQKTKEIAFTLPFVIVLMEFAVLSGRGGGVKKRLALLVPFLLTLVIIPVSIVATELVRSVPASAPAMPSGAGAPADSLSRLVPGDLKKVPLYDYLVTQFSVVMTYLRLMVLPVAQNLEYDYPVYRSIFSPAPLLSLLFHIGAFAGAVYLYIRARASSDLLLLLISFGVVFFYMTLSIESSVIPLSDVIFEHRMYLPGIGLFIAFSAAFFYAWGRIKGGSPSVAAAVLLAVTALPLAYASHKRNAVWSDKLALYEDTARKSPGSARARNNLGVEYGKLGMLKEAIVEFEATLRIKPEFIETYKNLANAYYHTGRPDEAIGVYREVLRLKPRDKVARTNLAGIYYEVGLVDSAVKEYETILSDYPNYVEARNNLANIFLSEGQFDRAAREYERVLAVRPGHIESVYNIAIAFEKSGRMDKAAYYYRIFLENAPPEYQSYKDEIRARLMDMGRR